MCLAIPARVMSIDRARDTAKVALGAVAKEISLALVEAVDEGDYVLVHVGYALNKISEEEAERTLALMAEMGLLDETDEDAPAVVPHHEDAPSVGERP